MISLDHEYIYDVQNAPSAILSWEVWFRGPTGLFKSLDDGRKWCESHDMNPDLMLVPVPVAIGKNTYEAVSR